jgi:chromosome segregation ATPase
MSTEEAELAAILHRIESRDKPNQVKSRLSIAIPVVVAVLLFGFIGRAAERYRQELIATQKALEATKGEASDYKRQLDAIIVSPEGIKRKLERYKMQRDQITEMINEGMNKSETIQKELTSFSQKLKLSLDDASNIQREIEQSEGKHNQDLEQLYKRLMTLCNNMRTHDTTEANVCQTAVSAETIWGKHNGLMNNYQRLKKDIMDASESQNKISEKSNELKGVQDSIKRYQLELININTQISTFYEKQIIK